MDTNHELKPIACDDWPELRDMYKREWPKHEIAYNTIQNYINWVKIDPNIKQLQVLGLNNSWRENGTYIVVDRYQMFLYSMEESNDSLTRALELIDWDYSYMICGAHISRRAALKDVFKSLHVDLLWEEPGIKYELLKDDCLKLNIAIPEGLYLRKLEVKDASIANELWPFSCEGSEYFLNRLAAWNTSVGLFHESGEMLAWSFCWPTGAIGPLEVAKNHLRKGYGSLIAKAIAKEVAKVGMNCYGTVVSSNKPSIAMFEKLGFLPVEDHYFFRTRARKLVEYDH